MTATIQTVNLSGNSATRYTLRAVRKIIEAYKINPEIRKIFINVLNGVDGRDSAKVIKKIDEYVKNNVRYQRDVNDIETLQTPLRTLNLGFGDCDDFTILLGTLFEAAGFETRSVLVSVRPNKIFHHIFIQVYDGIDWISVDPVEDFTGIGFKQPLTAYYIEGGEKDMKLLTLEGLSNENVGAVFPVLMGDDNLGWGFNPIKVVSSAVNKVSSAVSNVVKVIPVIPDISKLTDITQITNLKNLSPVDLAKSVYNQSKSLTENAADIAKAVANKALPIVNLTALPLKAVTSAINNELKKIPVLSKVAEKADSVLKGADKIVRTELQNAINNIDDPRKALLQLSNYSGYFPPQIGVPLAFVAQFVNNPTIDKEQLAIMAAKSVKIPGTTMSVYELYMLAKKIKEIVEDPKKLLTVDNAVMLAKEVGARYGGVSKETMDKINQVYDKVKSVKDLYDQGKSYYDKIKNLEDVAKSYVGEANKEVLKQIASNQQVINQAMDNMIDKKLLADKVQKFVPIAKEVIPGIEINSFFDLPEADIVDKIISNPNWLLLPKEERIKRLYSLTGKQLPSVELEAYLKLENPEAKLVTDVYEYLHNTDAGKAYLEQKKQAIVDKAKTDAFNLVPDTEPLKPLNFVSVKSLEMAVANPYQVIQQDSSASQGFMIGAYSGVNFQEIQQKLKELLND